MFILKPQMPLGEYIHSSLRSSHLKSREQSPYSLFRPSESKCYLLLHPLSLPDASPLVKHRRSSSASCLYPCGSTLPEMKGLPSTSPLPCFSSTPTPPLSSSEKTLVGNLPQRPQTGNMPPHSVPALCIVVTLPKEMDLVLFIFVSPNAGDT